MKYDNEEDERYMKTLNKIKRSDPKSGRLE